MHKTQIDGEKIILTEITANDAEKIVSWRSQPRIYNWLFDARPLDLNTHMRWFEDRYLKDDSRTDYMIIEKQSGKPAGVAGIHFLESGAELSYMIGEESMTGKGIAKSAVLLLIEYAKEQGAKTAIARILDGNQASINLVSSLGFLRFGKTGTQQAAGIYTMELL